MIQINNFIGSNDNLKIVEQRGIFTIFQHNTDMSVGRSEAQEKYFMQQMKWALFQNKWQLHCRTMRFD